MKSKSLTILSFLIILTIIAYNSASAQRSFKELYPVTSIKVLRNNQAMHNPWAGGLNRPMISPFNANFDTLTDMYIFDKEGDKSFVLINTGKYDSIGFKYAPQFNASFMHNVNMYLFGYSRDFDCDGIYDLITRFGAGLRLYYGDTTNGAVFYTEATSSINYKDGAFQTNIWVGNTDVPIIEDVDFDGDMDIVSYGLFFNFPYWYENLSADSGKPCRQYDFFRHNDCWGNFLDDADPFKTCANLVSCKKGGSVSGGPRAPRHAGAALCAIDAEKDGDYDIVLGQTFNSNCAYLRNGGTAKRANMDSVDCDWPKDDTLVNQVMFPVGWKFDVNNDNWDDVIVTPFEEPIPWKVIDHQNVWYYENDNNGNFDLQGTDFLVGEMLDAGRGAFPVVFDWNNDTLMDILVGTYGEYDQVDSVYYTRMKLLVNTGTKDDPEYTLADEDYHNLSLIGINNLSPTFGDLNDDGLEDMIVGTEHGRLRLYRNVALGDTADYILKDTFFFNLKVDGNAKPLLYDIDSDGDLDLIVGNKTGKIHYFPNQGDSTKPIFSNGFVNPDFGGINTYDPLTFEGNPTIDIGPWDTTGEHFMFVGQSTGWIGVYRIDQDSILSGSFDLVDTLGLYLDEGSNSYPAVHDLNDDGYYEVIIGNERGGLTMYSQILLDSINDIIIIDPPIDSCCWLLDSSCCPIDTCCGPTDSSCCDTTVVPGFDMPVFDQLMVNIFPNPNNGHLNLVLQTSGIKNANLEVYNPLGQKVYKRDLEATKQRYDLDLRQYLQKGVYFFRVNADGRSVVKKVMIE